MTLMSDIVKERLREAFGSDSQETIGKKLNMTQGNVSKLLSGTQQPTVDTLYRVSTVYDVSVDWIMGLSDRKKSIKPDNGTTYGLAVDAIQDIIHGGSELVDKQKEGKLEIIIKDPILVKLIRKSHALSKTDWELFKDWKRNKLSMFDDKQIIWSRIFLEDNISFLVSEATTEKHLLEVYDTAKMEEEEYVAMMEDNHSPFKG